MNSAGSFSPPLECGRQEIDLSIEDLFQVALCHLFLQHGTVLHSLLNRAGVFSPNVLWREFDVEHGGADMGVSHQMHQGGNGDSRASHIRSEGMATMLPKT